MDVINRTERRRTYSDAEKAVAVAEASMLGVTVRGVSRRLECVALEVDDLAVVRLRHARNAESATADLFQSG